MIWGPFLLALALGLAVSAGLYFAYLWPQVEPDDEALDATAAPGSAAGPTTESAAEAKSDATTAAEPEPAQATAASDESAAATSEASPSSESSPA